MICFQKPQRQLSNPPQDQIKCYKYYNQTFFKNVLLLIIFSANKKGANIFQLLK